MLKELSKQITIIDVMTMKENLDDFLSGFLTVCMYNGYEYYLKEFREYIEANEQQTKYYNIGYPNEILKGETSSAGGIIWSMLVLKFGSYGTSPRFGWIDGEKVESCLYFLDWIIELFEDKED